MEPKPPLNLKCSPSNVWGKRGGKDTGRSGLSIFLFFPSIQGKEKATFRLPVPVLVFILHTGYLYRQFRIPTLAVAMLVIVPAARLHFFLSSENQGYKLGSGETACAGWEAKAEVRW